MTDLPSSALPPALPQVVRSHRRRWIIVSVVVVVVVLGLTGAAVVWMLQRSADGLPIFGELPLAGQREEEFVTPPAATPTPTPSPTPTPPAFDTQLLQLDQTEQDNIGVTITYLRNPQFTLQITQVQRTFAAPTIDTYAPVAGASFSLIRLKDAAGIILLERPFAVATEVVAEGESSTGNPVIPLNESVNYLVLPGTGGVPASVELVTSAGEVFAQQAIQYDQLPRQTATTPTIDTSLFLESLNP